MKKNLILIFWLVLQSIICNAQSGIITTVIGNGSSGYTGDGGPATAAGVNDPTCIVIDGSGNIYFGESYHCVIRKVNTSGIITTIAGTGTPGFSGDGGPATAAQLSGPQGLAIDATGNIFIADFGRIRKINTAGIITTVAGTGASSSSGDGGPATAATIVGPWGISTDAAGNIFLCDESNRIRKINMAGIIATVAGNGTSGFSGDGGPASAAELNTPQGVVTDLSGNVIFADRYNNRIRKIDASGIITTIAGSGSAGPGTGSFGGDGGPATSALLYAPMGIGIDAYGNLYFSDHSNYRIRKINAAGIISTVAGDGISGFSGDGGLATNASISAIEQVAIDSAGSIYVPDFYNFRVRKIIPTSLSPSFTLGHTQFLTVCENSTSNSVNTLLSIYDSSTALTATWSLLSGPAHGTAAVAYATTTSGGILTPTGRSYTPNSGYYGTDSFKVRVTDGINSDTTNVIVTVNRFEAGIITGSTTLCSGSTTSLTDTTSGGTWSSSNVAIATIGSSGVVTAITGGTDTIIYTITNSCGLTNSIKIITVNTMPLAITGIDSTQAGGYTTLFDSIIGGIWSCGNPAIATVGSGNGVVAGVVTGTVTITYSTGPGCNATTLVRVTTNGGLMINTIAGNGTGGYSGDGGFATETELYEPFGITTDNAGNIYFADESNQRIRKINASGIISTIAGTGIVGFSGDGGPATNAQIGHPGYIHIDGTGNIYFGDLTNHRIRKINTSGIITTFAGNGGTGHSGDGGLATAAQIDIPAGLTMDGAGNLYIAESTYPTVRKVSTSGIISTIAGNGTIGFSGDGGPATNAALYGTEGITIDNGGNLYISDMGGYIRKVNISGIITTIAGIGSGWYSGDGGPATAAALGDPTDISFDGVGNLYIACWNSYNIRKINASGIISTITGNPYLIGFSGDHCAATAATLSSGRCLATDATGNIYFTDAADNRIREIGYINHNPYFTGGHNQSIIFCTIPATDSINSLLTISDADTMQDETWNVVSMPLHGILYANFSATSNGIPVTPYGLYYTPTTGYTGTDSFKVKITDCLGASDTTTIHATINSVSIGISGSSFLCTGAATTLTDSTTGGNWSSSNTAIATVGSISGVVTGISSGIVMITYTAILSCGTIRATKLITVNPSPSVISGSTGVCMGSSITLTDGGGGAWATSSTNITLGTGTGIVTGVSTGPALITYTLSTGCSITRGITVNPVPLPITGTSSICSSDTSMLSDGTSGGTWTSSNPSVAYVTPLTGVVTGNTGGTTTLSYTLAAGCYSSFPFTVNPTPGPISGLTSICAGISTVLSNILPGGHWSSSDPSVAPIVATSGVYTGTSPGYAFITYAMGSGCSVTIPVLINLTPGHIVGITSVCVGFSSGLYDTVAGGTWSSTAPLLATTDPVAGIVTGVALGTPTIFYTLPDGCAVSTTVTVNNTAGAIAGPSQICVNGTATLIDPTGGGTWTSSAPAIAMIGSSSGVLTGLLSGTVTVTYSIGAGCSATKVITVNPLPAPISGTTVVCVGSATTLSDPTPGGVWSSTVVANGSISSSGVLTGIGAGNTVIDYTLPATGCSRAVTATVNPQPAVISGPLVVCQGATITLSDATAGGSWSAGTGTISLGTGTGIVLGVSAGTAAVTYALSTGCARTKVITVNPLPSAISGPASLCQGATASLTDAGGGVWSTISSSATIGSLTGLVSGVSGGTALITYTLSTGCSVTRTETINPLPMPISGPGALCPGTTMTLTDAGGGTWSSMTPAVATIGTSTGIVSGLITGTTTVTYTLATGCTTSKVVTVSTTPTAIAGSSTVCLGGTTTLTDTVAGGSWFSAIPTTASIGTLSGIVTGSATGVTTITYSLGTGCTVTKTITVVPSPAAISGGSSSICISGTSPMTDATTGGIWSVGTGSVSVSGTGVVTGVAAGVATIDYTVAGCTATKGITVNATPTPISGSGSVCAGVTITESDGTGGGVWSASGTAISVGSGSGIVTGGVSGTGTLTYAIGSCSVSRTISVNPVPSISGATGLCTGTTSTLTASITGGTWYSSAGCVSVGSATGIITGVSPGTATITYTLATGCTASVIVTVNGAPGAITGTLHVCAGATTALSDGTGGGIWSIVPLTVATVGSSSGIVSGNLPGTATVTYSLGSGCTKTAMVTVNPVPAAITGTAQVCAGLTTMLADATTGGTWSSGTTATGSISGGGVVSGIVAGITNIYYTLSGCSVTVPFTVNPLPSAIAGTTGMCAGLTTPFTDITASGTWSSSPVAIATVGSGGNVLGVSAGTAIISYTLPTGCLATKTIIINSAPIAIAGGSMVCIGSALALADGTSGGTWSSMNLAVGSIGSTGVVTGLSTGTTVISYTVGGCPAMKTVTVNTPPGPISGPAIVCISATVNAMDAGGGLWSSSNPVIATIGTSSGIISGVAAGTATITYSLGAGCTVTEMITVNPLPASITASTSNVCSGATLALSDATPGGVWGSGSLGVATVSTAGVVTGVTGGISIITYTAPSGCMATRSITVIGVAPITGVHNICAYGDTMTVSDVPGTGLYISSLATVTNLGGGLGRVTGNTPGSASVTYILPAGCTGTAWFTVNPLPAAIAGSGSICVGSTAALTDATPGGTWSAGAGIVSVGIGSGVVTGIAGGTGYITYTLSSTGCKVDTSEIVYSMPGVITGASSLFLGTPITLSDAVTGGIWSSSNTLVATVVAGTGHVTGISVGAVTITYATGGICPVTKHLTVMPTAGRNGPLKVESGETEQGNAVRVSPNPGDGGFTIDLTWATEETVHITISNVAGMKIKDWSTVTVKDGVVSIPVQVDVASGVYLLSVDGNDYKYVTKVVVER